MQQYQKKINIKKKQNQAKQVKKVKKKNTSKKGKNKCKQQD